MTTNSDIEKLFRSNYTAMLTLAIRLLHDTDTARDIVHDVFESVLSENLSTVTPAYLLTGIRFACMKHLRSLSLRERSTISTLSILMRLQMTNGPIRRMWRG